MTREIVGIADGKCSYIEQMPNNGEMSCKFTETMREGVAQYYKDVAKAESGGTSVQTNSNGESQIIYTIDGKQVKNPLQEAILNGQCVVSGYK